MQNAQPDIIQAIIQAIILAINVLALVKHPPQRQWQQVCSFA
jgi:hypothetical protein